LIYHSHWLKHFDPAQPTVHAKAKGNYTSTYPASALQFPVVYNHIAKLAMKSVKQRLSLCAESPISNRNSGDILDFKMQVTRVHCMPP
jgi:hypothetical protein